jgi:polysaccharide export outer membrane protein
MFRMRTGWLAFGITMSLSMFKNISLKSLLLIALAAVVPSAAAQEAEPSIDRYRIGFQDTLEIQVFKHPELSLRVSVNPNGTIFIPRAEGPIIAVCKTERELADEIAEIYRKFLRDPFVNVVVADQKSQSFGVIGAVEKPGTFYINRQVQLLELLSLAGGPNKEAGNRIIVARTGSSSACKKPGETDEALRFLTFRMRDVQEGRQSLWMKPGDVVSVLDADLVFVLGNVNKQGEVKMREPITLRQAIASAEGFSPAAKRDRIRLLRQKGDTGEWEESVFNLKEIDAGIVRDPILVPNDIVAVSEDRATSIVLSVSRSISNSLFNLPIILAR